MAKLDLKDQMDLMYVYIPAILQLMENQSFLIQFNFSGI